tara:strand:- start:127 stop:255 length:129 start_codon:yes stop_codon:yes gene_type:complete
MGYQAVIWAKTEDKQWSLQLNKMKGKFLIFQLGIFGVFQKEQ